MQPIYIKCFKEKFKKKSITNYILSANKNYASNDEIRLIIYSPLRGFNLYLDKNVEDYFNLYFTKWSKLEKLISINKYFNSEGFTLI